MIFWIIPDGYRPIGECEHRDGHLIRALEARPDRFELYWAAWRDGEWRTVPRAIERVCHPTHWKEP